MPSEVGAYSGRTAWVRNLETPLRTFLRTETGSAAVLLAGVVAALVWANVDVESYVHVWEKTTLSIHIGDSGLSNDLRYWVNAGLMTLFFFVIGLEARREFDLGELRDRRRVQIPLAAGIGGMLIPVAIFLALNAGRSSAHGWGVAMSTDTAFALGLLALVGSRGPFRLRAFVLTFAVVDDVIALVVIATVYATAVDVGALTEALAIFALIIVVRQLRIRIGAVYAVLGIATWIALSRSGVDPIVVGLAMGLLTYAAPASRSDLERATDLFRLFREQPTPELARSAQVGVATAISPNERLQEKLHPWTSYVIVPLFALANAGIAIDAGFLGRAFTSTITLGILIGYVLGKPVGVVGGSWLVTKLSLGGVRPPVGWAALVGGGGIAGIGFTVAILIADLAFEGDQLAEAKAGILSAALAASILSWTTFRATARLPWQRRVRALLGSSESIVDLAVPVDPERDHVRGPTDAPVTLVEYGDFECPYCGRAEPVIRELMQDFGDLRYVWRHLPLNDVHLHTQTAAEAAEATGEQGAFWEMYDLLLAEQSALEEADLIARAKQLGLDIERFRDDLEHHRHYGAYDIDTLTRAVRAARARAAMAA